MTTTRRKPAPGTVVREPSVRARIVVIRGSRVILDRDIAELYGVGTRALNQAVARNRTRFPADFAYRLTATEVSNLKSQSVTSSSHGGRRKLPRAFTEHGVAMLSGVLRGKRAVQANVAIMRAFVRLREVALSHAELTGKIMDLERRYDGQFAAVFDAIRRLMGHPAPPDPPRPRIGFITERVHGAKSRARGPR